MTSACPSDLKLERHLLAPATSGLASHFESCASCRERLRLMEKEGEDFRRFVYPATVDTVVEAAGRHRALRWIGALGAHRRPVARQRADVLIEGRAMSAPCPSDLKLEAYLLAPASSEVAPHVAECPSCRERVRRMEEEGEDFRRFVHPATVDAVVGAAGARRPLRWIAALVPATALAVAGVLLVLHPGPPADYLGVKGDALGLTVFVGGPNGAWTATDGAAVPASAALRFQVRPAAPCRLWIVSIDTAGQVSRLYPAQGDGGAEVNEAGPLPGGAVLDGQRGPERIFATCTPGPLPLATLIAACRASAASGEQAVRSAKALMGLPKGTLQESLLLEKEP